MLTNAQSGPAGAHSVMAKHMAIKDGRVREITPEDISSVTGAPLQELRRYCSRFLDSMERRYTPLEGAERDAVILRSLQIVHHKDTSHSGVERHQDWEAGWGENLREFVESGHDVDKLIPKYFQNDVPARFGRQYIRSLDPRFVFNHTDLFRTWLFRRYLDGFEHIHEFGCGPAYQLACLARLYPDAKLYGYDWTQASVDIQAELARAFGWSVSGRRFDFFNPDRSVSLAPGSAVYTIGALEQVHDKFGPFLDFLLSNKPALVVNVECLEELYDPDDLVDYLALLYHRRRRYLSGYLGRLRELEADGRIEIIRTHHHLFGNIYNDTLSYVIWRPL